MKSAKFFYEICEFFYVFFYIIQINKMLTYRATIKSWNRRRAQAQPSLYIYLTFCLCIINVKNSWTHILYFVYCISKLYLWIYYRVYCIYNLYLWIKYCVYWIYNNYLWIYYRIYCVYKMTMETFPNTELAILDKPNQSINH